MRRVARISVALLLFCQAFWSGIAFAAEPCLIALDLGSSGIRAGSNDATLLKRAPFNALALLEAAASVSDLEAPTVQTINSLLHQGAFDASCNRLGGGFSVWRLALQQNPAALATVLRHIQALSGVAILVIPPAQEGQYAYIAARHSLGENLTTTHVLDIGGGSMQISSATGAIGLPLGQKTWHQLLCRELGKGESACILEPLSLAELDLARKLAASQLKPILDAVPSGSTLTAVSRPVTRGIKPYIDEMKLAATPAEPIKSLTTADSMMSAAELIRAIDQTAPNRLAANTTTGFSLYRLSDMLLLEGIMQSMGLETVTVAEFDLTNVPGLLNDARAYAWMRLYECYLSNLTEQGITAFDRNPGECRPLVQ